MKLATHNEILLMNARQLRAYHKKLAKAEQELATIDLELKQEEEEKERQEIELAEQESETVIKQENQQESIETEKWNKYFNC